MAESKMAKIIVRSVDRLDAREEDLDLDQISTAVGVLEKIDKLGRLERGEATERVEVDQGFTLRDIKNGARIVHNEHQPKEIPYVEESEEGPESTENKQATGSNRFAFLTD